jgi:Secretion system C-terminal sorting domain
MNKLKIFFTIIVLCNINKTFAQCPQNNINTNWDPSYVLPNNGTHQTNTFDWTQQQYLINKPDIQIFGSQTFAPFWSNDDHMKDIASPSNIDDRDCSPEDGWELIKQDMGYIYDQSASPAWQGPINGLYQTKRLPYVILYNKYEAKLRILGLDKKFGAFSKTRISLSYVPTTPATDASALFNTYNGVQFAVDQKTKRNRIAAGANYIDNRWFYTDFAMAYDPCVCFFESKFQVDFDYIEIADLKASARLIGIAYGKDDIIKVNGSSDVLYGDNLPTSEDFALSFMEDYGSSLIDNNVMAQHYRDVNKLIAKLTASDNKNNSDYQGTKDALKALSLLAKGVALSNPKIYVAAKIVKGLGIGLDGMDFFSTMGKSKDKAKQQPMIVSVNGLIDGQVMNAVSSGSAFHLSTPGSKNAELSSEYGYAIDALNPSYPMYNNSLGLFTLTKTPIVKKFTQIISNGTSGNSTPITLLSHPSLAIGNYSMAELKKSISTSVCLDLTTLKYTLNPIVKEATILVGLEVVYKDKDFDINKGNFRHKTTRLNPINCSKVNYNLQNIGTIHTYDGANYITIGGSNTGLAHSTSAYSLVDGEVFEAVNVVVSILYEFKPDAQGKIAFSSQLLKYHTNVTEVPTLNQLGLLSPGAIKTILVNGTLGPNPVALVQDVYSDGVLTISGNITNNTANHLFIRAENEIVLLDGATIGPNITLEIFPTVVCDGEPQPIETNMENYCTSKIYKANELSAERIARLDTTKINQNLTESDEFLFSVFPNPTSDNINLVWNKKNFVSKVFITDAIGKTIIDQELTNDKDLQLNYVFEISYLPSGIYFANVLNKDGSRVIRKFIKQ